MLVYIFFSHLSRFPFCIRKYTTELQNTLTTLSPDACLYESQLYIYYVFSIQEFEIAHTKHKVH